MALQSICKPIAAFAFMLCAIGSASAAIATSDILSQESAKVSIASSAHELTEKDVAAWLDGLMPTALHTAQVPGAMVVVVKDGQILVQKGYGFSNYEKRTRVDSKTTLFRPGSISKLFTWTAVMQLVEQGKLDLDVDINTYLDFKIPDRNGKPLTMRQVMKHTTGFEEAIKDLLSFGSPPPSLGDVLKSYVPPRMFDAGTTPGYSNYATGIAGYIVQRVSGQPYDDYIEQHIFKPLEMHNSSFRQPLSPSMQANMSLGYKSTWDKPGDGFEMINIPPAGSLSATGEDMGHFMIAQLQDGRFGNQRILKPETAELMHSSVTRALPDLNGIALGFYEQNINGHRVIAHGGDTVYFHSDLQLWRDDNVGIYISVNAPGKDNEGAFLRDQFFHEFADRYLPGTKTTARVDPITAMAHAKMIEGRYAVTRGSDSTFVSIFKLLGLSIVESNPDGSISASPYGPPRKYVETSPFLWQEVGGHDRLQAIVKDGKVTRWSTDAVAFAFVFEPVGGLAGLGAELPLMIVALVLMALCVLSWPVTTALHRYYRVDKSTFSVTGKRALGLRLVRIAATISLVAAGVWSWLFMLLSDAAAGLAPLVFAAQLLSLLGLCGGLIASLWNTSIVFKFESRWISRTFAVILALAFAYLTWIGLRYHLIGFASKY